MELLIADESSITWDAKVGYFIYGGIVINESEAKPLAEAILKIKEGYGVEKERPTKWSNGGWQGDDCLDPEIHKEIKDSILTVFSESNSKIIVCLSPHFFYHNPTVRDNGQTKMSIDPETLLRTHKYGMNDLLGKFDSYLGFDKYGIVLADTFNEALKIEMNKHCKDCFPNGNRKLLTNIVHPVIQINNEDGHLHQINDVVLGAICTSLREMELNFLPRIKDNFWAKERGGVARITGAGFNIYPEIATTGWCKRSNSSLQAKFNRLINQV